MKRLTSLLSLLLAFIMAFAMTSCKDDSKKFDPDAEAVPYVVKTKASATEDQILNDLAALIEQGRTSLDVAVRKPIYSQALDKVMELAIELPTYQRKNLYVYDKTVIDESSLITGEDVTPYQSPLAKIWDVSFANSADNSSKALVVASQTMDGLFNPFFYTSGYDESIVSMTNLSLLTSDKTAAIVADDTTVASEYKMVMKDASGNVVTDSAQAATTDYVFTIRNNLKFSDGTAVTMEDVLFNFYMYLDPAYSGSSTMYALPIVGLDSYRTQLPDALYVKYSALVDAIYAAGKGEYVANETYTEEQQSAFWTKFDENGAAFAQSIVDYVAANSGSDDYVKAYFSPAYTWEQIKASEGLKVAFGMGMWGFGEFDKAGKFVADEEHSWTLAEGDVPTAADYFAVIEAAYGSDYEAIYSTEAADASRDFVADTKSTMISEFGSSEFSGKIESVSGIKTEGNTLTVTISGIDPVAIYQLSPVIAPKAYYTKGYTYGQDALTVHGVEFKSVDFMNHVREIAIPVGAGPYVATDASNRDNPAYADFYNSGMVYLKANQNFVLGAPKITYLRYQEVSSSELYNAVKTGTVHYADPSADSATITKLQGEDKNQLGYQLVDNLGYGYIGINARYVNELEARRAIMYAMDRSPILDYYTGGLASIIERGMSKVNWAYPEGATAYYPFDGTGMKSFELLRSVGYQVKNPETGLWYNPDGPTFKLTFTVAGDSLEGHPASNTMLKAKDILNSIGCDIDVVIDADALSKLTTSDSLAVWCAAWQATIDPDMYQVYHKDSQATSVLSWGYDYLLGKVGSLAPWATSAKA